MKRVVDGNRGARAGDKAGDVLPGLEGTAIPRGGFLHQERYSAGTLNVPRFLSAARDALCHNSGFFSHEA